MKKIKVCWISNIPSPYKVDLMNLMANDIELYCLFLDREFKTREKSWYNHNFNFTAYYLDEHNSFKLIKQMAKECDCLINSDYTRPTCMMAVELFNKYHKPTIMQADGGIAEDRGFLINRVMSLVMGRNKYFLSSGKETDKYFNYYKVLSSKIYHYRFTTYNKQEVFSNYEMTKYKCEYRNRLSLKGDFIIFSVGQQIHRKGYDILAQAAIGLPEDIQIYIAGGNPNEETLNVIKDNNLSNIHFIGFKSKEELFEYYAASDIFVMPTRYDIWGLVINEAMSFGLPIISTNKCVAALEFSQMGDIGYIVPVDDVREMHQRIIALYENKELAQQKGNDSYRIIKDYHLENMCDDYIQAICSIINKAN